jgi:hypothetical protein
MLAGEFKRFQKLIVADQPAKLLAKRVVCCRT